MITVSTESKPGPLHNERFLKPSIPADFNRSLSSSATTQKNTPPPKAVEIMQGPKPSIFATSGVDMKG